jgi:hypothetical protein
VKKPTGYVELIVTLPAGTIPRWVNVSITLPSQDELIFTIGKITVGPDWHSRLIRNEVRKRWLFLTDRRNNAGVPAKISLGGRRYGSKFLMLYIPANPVTDMKARRADTTKKSRLFPVFTAEKPMSRVITM